jgi:hypothetical protein
LIYKSELDGKEEGNAFEQNLLQSQARGLFWWFTKALLGTESNKKTT